jgi:hypothetical protein
VPLPPSNNSSSERVTGVEGEGVERWEDSTAAGTQFTCCTGTKVQILTQLTASLSRGHTPALTSHTSLPDFSCSHTSHSHSTTSDALQRDTSPRPGGAGGGGADVHLVRFDKVKMEKSFVLAQRVEERLTAVVEALQVCTLSYYCMRP